MHAGVASRAHHASGKLAEAHEEQRIVASGLALLAVEALRNEGRRYIYALNLLSVNKVSLVCAVKLLAVAAVDRYFCASC